MAKKPVTKKKAVKKKTAKLSGNKKCFIAQDGNEKRLFVSVIDNAPDNGKIKLAQKPEQAKSFDSWEEAGEICRDVNKLFKGADRYSVIELELPE